MSKLTATVRPDGSTPFQKGDAEVNTQAVGWDPTYGTYVNVKDKTVVSLRKA
jgi:hypothetical protein